MLSWFFILVGKYETNYPGSTQVQIPIPIPYKRYYLKVLQFQILILKNVFKKCIRVQIKILL